MKISKYIFPLLIVLMTINTNYSQPDNPNTNKKTYTVLVMPFYDYEHYPYLNDQIRESFINGFTAKGFVVVTNDDIWSEILDFDYNLANISTDMADSIAQKTSADLIVFGNMTPFSNTRNTGFNTPIYIYKPVLIKVYDANKKSLVIFDRANVYDHWGRSLSVRSLYDMAVNVATRLNTMGY